MQRFKWFFLLLTGIAFVSFKPKEKIKWITLEQLAVEYSKNPKPILIDLYTDWCGWCKVMDKNTYSNEKVVKYINANYYAIKFDAESKKEVVFNGKTYKYNPQYKSNDLAVYLTFGRLEFPNTVFLSSPDARPAPLAGYMKPSELEGPLKFFGEKASDKQTYIDFEKTLKKEW